MVTLKASSGVAAAPQSAKFASDRQGAMRKRSACARFGITYDAVSVPRQPPPQILRTA